MLKVFCTRTRRGEMPDSSFYTASVPRLAEIFLYNHNFLLRKIVMLGSKIMMCEEDTFGVHDRFTIEGPEEDITRFAIAYRLWMELVGGIFKDDDMEKLNIRLASTRFEHARLYTIFHEHLDWLLRQRIFARIISVAMDVADEPELNRAEFAEIPDLVAALELREEMPESSLWTILGPG